MSPFETPLSKDFGFGGQPQGDPLDPIRSALASPAAERIVPQPKPAPKVDIVGLVTPGNSGLADVGHGQKLAGPAAAAFLAAQKELAGLGVNISAGSGWRSGEQQAALYKAKPGLAAPPGHSLHEKGLALDIEGYNNQNIGQVAAVMKKYGFYWGGDWTSKKEPWHFSYGSSG